MRQYANTPTRQCPKASVRVAQWANEQCPQPDPYLSRDQVPSASASAAAATEGSCASCTAWDFQTETYGDWYFTAGYPSLPNSWTIEAWVLRQRFSGSYANGYFMSLSVNGNAECVLLKERGLPVHEWAHIVVTSGKRVYLNGVRQSTSDLIQSAGCDIPPNAGAQFVVNNGQYYVDGAPARLTRWNAADILVSGIAVYASEWTLARIAQRAAATCFYPQEREPLMPLMPL